MSRINVLSVNGCLYINIQLILVSNFSINILYYILFYNI